jgi:hypothetical protein
MAQEIESDKDSLARLEREIIEDTLSLRREFLASVPVVTCTQVQAKASVSDHIVDQWRTNGQIFAIQNAGQAWHPAFQFAENGQPLVIIARVLAILNRNPKFLDWDKAMWFYSPNGWLEDERSPMNCLSNLSEHDDLKYAAEQAVLRTQW